MFEMVDLKRAVERFAREGHLFYPDQAEGIGEVTVLCMGEEKVYVPCTTAQFRRKLSREFFKDERLLRDFAYETLGKRKHPPFVLHESLVLVPFWYPCFDNPAHRTLYACLSSIRLYATHEEQRLSCIVMFKDRHTITLPYSIGTVKQQMRCAEHLLMKYKLKGRASY